VRDLGGHSVADGRTTRPGAIVRADSLARLTSDGWKALEEYGVSTVIDLRMNSERSADPPRSMDLTVLHIPSFDEQFGYPPLPASTVERYLNLLEMSRDRFASVITAIAQASEGVVVVHCESGKDRTGLVAALLLRLVGVDRDVISTDYGLSTANLAPILNPWVEEAADEDERVERLRISTSKPENMLGVLAELEHRYGGVEAYLRAGGASQQDLDAVKARLLG
jgi:protein-tyrosine phosphatase